MNWLIKWVDGGMNTNFTSSLSSDKADSVVGVVVDDVVEGVLPNISAVALTACTFGNTYTTAEGKYVR